MKIDTQSFITVSQIIERDSKDTSYKFALLRATIDAISQYDQQIIITSNRVEMPLGLIIERWLWYYYPLIDSDVFLPQKNGEPLSLTKGKNISFRKYFTSLIDSYKPYGEFEHFYNDYKKGNLTNEVNHNLLQLVKDLHKTISTMPMKYIGKSVSSKEYSIYHLEKHKSKIAGDAVVNTEFLIDKFGTFSVPLDFYLVLKYLGSFIGGSNTLINNWADFIVKANRQHIVGKEYVLRKLYTHPESYRDVGDVKSFFKNKSNLHCVWSGSRLNKENINIDHILPFAHYLNNDIWNLLPALNKVNGKKRDKIPTPDLIDKRSDALISYWYSLQQYFQESFNSEVRVSLVPNVDMISDANWGIQMIESLKKKSEFLIDVRGLEPWEHRV